MSADPFIMFFFYHINLIVTIIIVKLELDILLPENMNTNFFLIIIRLELGTVLP